MREKILGDDCEGETPVPIPNTEVKPFSADGTAWEAVWESRTLPGLLFGEPICLIDRWAFLLCTVTTVVSCPILFSQQFPLPLREGIKGRRDKAKEISNRVG